MGTPAMIMRDPVGEDLSEVVLGHIPMTDPLRADVEDEEDVEDAERGRDG
jgi:hypothetical protein